MKLTAEQSEKLIAELGAKPVRRASEILKAKGTPYSDSNIKRVLYGQVENMVILEVLLDLRDNDLALAARVGCSSNIDSEKASSK